MGLKEPFKKSFTEKIKKKGFLFSSDAFIALMLFVVVLLGVYSYIVISNNMQQQYYFSDDLLEIFNHVTVSELDDEKYGFLGGYGVDLTIAEVIVQNEDDADLIIEGLTSGLISSQYGTGLYVGKTEVYNNMDNVSSSVSREKLVKDGEFFNITRLEIGIKGTNYTG